MVRLDHQGASMLTRIFDRLREGDDRDGFKTQSLHIDIRLGNHNSLSENERTIRITPLAISRTSLI
jgi:hypothetical protein